MSKDETKALKVGDVIQVFKIGDVYMSSGLWGKRVNGDMTPRADHKDVWLTFEEEPVTVESIVTREVVRTYLSQDGITAITAEEYRATALLGIIEGEFESIDAEYASKKFCSQWTPVRTLEETSTLHPFQVFELRTNGAMLPPYCSPVRLSSPDSTKGNLTLFSYGPKRFEMVRAVADEYDLQFTGPIETEGMCWSVPDHSRADCRFIMIGKAYTNYDALKRLNGALGTLEECEAIHRANVDMIHDFWQEAIAKCVKQPLRTVTAQDVIGTAQSLLKKLDGFHAVKKSEQYQWIGSMKNELQGLANRTISMAVPRKGDPTC